MCSPGSATNSPPGATFRESNSTGPVTSAPGSGTSDSVPPTSPASSPRVSGINGPPHHLLGSALAPLLARTSLRCSLAVASPHSSARLRARCAPRSSLAAMLTRRRLASLICSAPRSLRSSLVPRCDAHSPSPGLDRRPQHDPVVERVHHPGDLLALLVPLAGDQHGVARPGPADRLGDRLRPVADLQPVRVRHRPHPGGHGGAD